MDLMKRFHLYQTGALDPRPFANAEAARVASTFEDWHMSTFPNNHRGTVMSLDVDTLYGQFLLAASTDGRVRVHNILHPLMETSSKFKRSGRHRSCSMKYKHREVECIQWYPKCIAAFTSTGLDGHLKIWNVSRRKSVATFFPCLGWRAKIFQHSQSQIATTPLVAVASSNHTIPVHDLRYTTTSLRLPGHSSAVYACEWSPTDPYLLASGGTDGSLRLWDIRNVQHPRITYYMNHIGPKTRLSNYPIPPSLRAHNRRINGIKFTSDGSTVISFSTEHNVKMWDVYSGKHLDANCGEVVNPSRYHIQFATNHTTNPDLVFIQDGPEIIAVKVKTGEIAKRLRGHYGCVHAIAYNPLFEELYSGGIESSIHIWKPHQEQLEAMQIDAEQYQWAS